MAQIPRPNEEVELHHTMISKLLLNTKRHQQLGFLEPGRLPGGDGKEVASEREGRCSPDERGEEGSWAEGSSGISWARGEDEDGELMQGKG